MIRTRHLLVGLLVLASALAVAGIGLAQGKGGGGSRGGGGGGVAMSSNRSRLDALEVNFTLTKDQKKAIKAILDDAHKSAAPARDGLVKARADVAAAVQANKGQAEIDAAVKSYAEQSTAMATIETQALADLMKALDPPQRANQGAVSAAFFMLRGAFLDPKKWDDVPDGKLY
jgi:Spy/CpxP family protein refolding chaperone